MSDWLNNPALEAPSSRKARTLATADAWERATPPVLSANAIQTILSAANLDIATHDEARVALLGVLEALAREAVHSAFDGGHLTKRNHITPMLAQWRIWRETKNVTSKASARAKLKQLMLDCAGLGFGPIPSPFEHGTAFERWLAAEARALGVAWQVRKRSISRAALVVEVRSARNTAKSVKAIHLAPSAPRGAATGGHPGDRERDRRTERLLATFWMLYRKEPTGIDRHVSAAGRFIAAFEKAVEDALIEHCVSDPTRSDGRPRSWKVHESGNAAQHIERLIARYQEAWGGETGITWAETPNAKRIHIWERWRLAVNADGSPAPMLVRAEFAPFQK